MLLPPTYLANAAAGIATLQQWYNVTSGLWDTTGWWQSANVLTVVADYAVIEPRFLSEAQIVFENTYTQSQKTSARIENMPSPLGVLPNSIAPKLPMYHKHMKVTGFDGFINDYYDDEGWWALAWLKAYDLTNSSQYLQTAVHIFHDMSLGWNNGSCGGVWWNKNKTAINAISNELFLNVAAHLANRAPNKQYYLNWASKVWSWFQGTGMISVRYNINDGIDLLTCRNDLGTVWSYTQGVILGALVELNRAAPNSSYINMAVKVANAAIARLCDAEGVLHEPCEPECGADGPQFKGIFMRNLKVLQQVAPHVKFQQTIIKNADSIWAYNRGTHNRFGLVWSGPYDNKSTAATQSSACDALVAAASLNSLAPSLGINSR
ncbi:MAG: hypothetical protein Q9217_004873 [Psora testacea]